MHGCQVFVTEEMPNSVLKKERGMIKKGFCHINFYIDLKKANYLINSQKIPRPMVFKRMNL